MKLISVWITLSIVVCWSFIERTFAESPESNVDEEATDGESTTNPTTAAASSGNRLEIFRQYTKEENFTQAKQTCGNDLNGDLVKIVKLNFTENVALPLMTGWIGIRLSNSTFRWFSNETASQILECFPANARLPHCSFFECMDNVSGLLLIKCLYTPCNTCQELSAVFYACIKGGTPSPTPSSTVKTSTLIVPVESPIATKISTSTIVVDSSSSKEIGESPTPTTISSSTINIVSSSFSTKQTPTTSTKMFTSIPVDASTSIKGSATCSRVFLSSIFGSSSPIAKFTCRSITISSSRTITSISASTKTSTIKDGTAETTTISEGITTATTILEGLTTTISQDITTTTVATESVFVKISTIEATKTTTSPPIVASSSSSKITVLPTTSSPAATKPTTKPTTKPATEPNATPQPTTAVQNYNNSLHNINVSEKNAFEEIVKVTTLFINKEKTKGSNNSLLHIPQLLEKKWTEAAPEVLKRHNGTLKIKTVNFEILLTEIKKETKKPGDFLIFPDEDERNKTDNDSSLQLPEPVDFIKISLDSLPSGSIFVGVLYLTLGRNSSDPKNSTRPKLLSKIISAEVIPKPTGNLSNITFTLSHSDQGNQSGDCAFIDESKTSNDGDPPTFSTKGCSMLPSSDGTRTACTCNHMTSFAVVTKIRREKPVDASHRKALSLITYIGITLSLIGEILTVGSYVFLIGLNTEQAHLHTNLALSLGVTQIFFLVGMNSATNQVGCLLITALIHYFYLATFCWMLVEGFHLYLMVVKVFSESSYLKIYYLFSWITPLVVVSLALIAAAASPTGIYGYVSEEICWVSAQNNYIWFFLGPVLLICLANFVLLFLVVREMTRMNKTKEGVPSLQFRKSLKACLLLFPILGTTWVFCFLLMIKPSLAIEYIFVILNSLQGFLIFLFYVLRSSEIRAVLKQRKNRWATSLDLSNNAVSTYQKTTSTRKSAPTSASSIRPVMGNWVTPSPHDPPSPRCSLGLRRSPSPSPRNSPSPSPRNSPSPLNTPSLLTTSSLLGSSPDLFECPRRSHGNQISPDLLMDAETTA